MTENKKLPKDWKWVKLGEVCEVQTGTTPPKSDMNNYGNDIPFFKPPHLWDNVINETEEKLSIQGSKKARLVPANSVLVTCIGNLGRTGLVKKTSAFNQQINAIIENEKIIGKYIFYLAQAPFFRNQLEKLATGTTVSIVNKSNFETIHFPLPPLHTQNLIVAKIEELFSELDKGIENLRTAQQQLKTYRQSVLKWAFEGKLTNGLNHDLNDVDDDHDVKSKKKNQTNQTNQKNHSADKGDDEKDLPEGWKWVKSGEVIDVINNGYTPTKEFLFEGEGEIPFLKVYNLNFNGTLNFKKNPTFIPYEKHNKDLKRSICYPGDVLINIVGPPLGKVSIVSNQFPEWNINQAIVLFRPNEKIISKFIAYLMQNPETINWLESTSKATAGQWNVKVSTCREIPVPLPPLATQYLIVQEIESRLSVADKLEEDIKQSLQQAEALRQSILKKAFEGELV